MGKIYIFCQAELEISQASLWESGRQAGFTDVNEQAIYAARVAHEIYKQIKVIDALEYDDIGSGG